MMTTETPDKLAYATKPIPWLHRGTDVSDAPTAAEAMKLAGLNWTVATGTLRDEFGNEVPNFRNVYRTDTHQTLGIVGRIWEPIQNADGFDFLDSLVEDRVLRYAGAGSFNGGITCWMQAYLDGDVRILDDVYKRFLVARQQHDGKGAFSTHSGNLRVICANTLAMATSVPALVRVHHTGDVTEKLARARLTLKAVTDQQERYRVWLTKLGAVAVEPTGVQKVSEGLFGPLDEATPTRRASAIEAFLGIYRTERERQGANAYSLAQAVTGYADHVINTKEGQDRLESVLTGQINSVKTKGLALVSELAGVRM